MRRKILNPTSLRTCHTVSEVFIKVFKDANHTLVAACDSELIGQTFKEGKLKLEVKADFYRGDAVTISEALHAVDKADIANLVGKQIVQAAVTEGYVDPSAIIRIAGIPHVQILRL
jgi:hypothetical protein